MTSKPQATGPDRTAPPSTPPHSPADNPALEPSGDASAGAPAAGKPAGGDRAAAFRARVAAAAARAAAFTGERFTNFFSSIRFRLSLWFALVLALVLLVFGAFVYFRQAQDSYNQSAARLAIRLRELDQTLRRRSLWWNNNSWLTTPGSSPDNPTLIKDTEIMVLSMINGEVGNTWGPISKYAAANLARRALQVEDNRILIERLRASQNAPAGRYLLVTAPVLSDDGLIGWVTLGQPLDPEGLLPRLRLTLFLGGLATLVVALAGGYWLADRALHPVKAITTTAQSIGESDLSRRLNIHTRDELGELAGTFDRMLDRLQAAFNRQRQFTADASHELRTPLTIIGLETDRALSAGRSAEDYRRALRVIQSENAFMSHLVSELLTLARMDAGQINLKKEPVDLSDLALEVVERYAGMAEEKGILLRAGALPELTIQGDRQFLLQMAGNLVENAIKYHLPGPGRWVCVETSAAPGPTAHLRVIDNGPGIAAEHLPRLFDRFYRVDAARSRNTDEAETIPGSGLGLSIVQWIARVHGGEVTVESIPGNGTTFEVRLPLE